MGMVDSGTGRERRDGNSVMRCMNGGKTPNPSHKINTVRYLAGNRAGTSLARHTLNHAHVIFLFQIFLQATKREDTYEGTSQKNFII